MVELASVAKLAVTVIDILWNYQDSEYTQLMSPFLLNHAPAVLKSDSKESSDSRLSKSKDNLS